jgi:hypothetical protein
MKEHAMRKTTRFVLVLISVTSATMALGDHRRGLVKFDQSLSGTVLTVQLFNPLTGEVVPKSVNDGKGLGAPGPSTFRNLVRNEGPIGACEDGGLKFAVVEFETVVTFNDGSMLFAVLDSTAENMFCLDVAVTPPIATRTVQLVVTGGTGRFQGATGRLHERITGQNLGPAGLGQITGSRSGRIMLQGD